MNDNISFRRLKTLIKTKGYNMGEFAQKCGLAATSLTSMCNDKRHPKTDLLAKVCSVLQVYPSEVVLFEKIKINENHFSDDKREKLPLEFSGELTYKPLWDFLADYLNEWNKSNEIKKTEKDFFDSIEPPRRLNGVKAPPSENLIKARNARWGEGYTSQRTNRTDYSKGLNAVTRTKLRNDKPLNLSVIYEICKKLGCTIDFVLSYK